MTTTSSVYPPRSPRVPTRLWTSSISFRAPPHEERFLEVWSRCPRRQDFTKQVCGLDVSIAIIEVDLFTLFALHGPDKAMRLLWLLQTNHIRFEECRTGRSSFEGEMIERDLQAMATAGLTDASNVVTDLTSALYGGVGDLIKRNLLDVTRFSRTLVRSWSVVQE